MGEGNGMSTHELKTWPKPFEATGNLLKSFELRKNDRGFEVNDTLVLHEFDPDTEQYTNRSLNRTVVYILRGPAFGLPEGYVIMSVEP